MKKILWTRDHHTFSSFSHSSHKYYTHILINHDIKPAKWLCRSPPCGPWPPQDLWMCAEIYCTMASAAEPEYPERYEVEPPLIRLVHPAHLTDAWADWYLGNLEAKVYFLNPSWTLGNTVAWLCLHDNCLFTCCLNYLTSRPTSL